MFPKIIKIILKNENMKNEIAVNWQCRYCDADIYTVLPEIQGYCETLPFTVSTDRFGFQFGKDLKQTNIRVDNIFCDIDEECIPVLK